MVWLLVRPMEVLCHPVPLSLVRKLPHAHAILSLVSLYIFFQALGLVWLFGVPLLAVLGTRLVSAFGATGLFADGVFYAVPRILRHASPAYVYYCVVRFLFLFSHSMWIISWEMYHDFPTMRRMLVGTSQWTAGTATPAAATPATTPANPQDAATKWARARRRSIVLCAPLAVLSCANIALLVGQQLCGDSCHQVFEPTSGANRNLRFVLFLSMLQWAQVWMKLFPQWHQAFLGAASKNRRSLLCLLILVPLLVLSWVRLVGWFLKPAGNNVAQELLFGIKHHVVDCVLVTVWHVWLLLACFAVLGPEALRHSGFYLGSITDDVEWRGLCMAFKHTCFIWMFLRFLRCCFSWGFARAQTDLIIATFIYPVQISLIWTFTFVVVVVSRWKVCSWRFILSTVIGLLFMFAVAQRLCDIAGRAHLPILVFLVWLHLCRQLFRVGRAVGELFGVQRNIGELYRNHSVSSPHGPNPRVDFALDPSSHEELRQTYGVERRWARYIIRVMLAICITFALVLMTLYFLGLVQKYVGIYAKDLVTWKHVPGGVEINNAGVSVLTLTRDTDDLLQDNTSAVLPPGSLPHYAICGHTYHGLSLVEYSFLALAAYITPTPETDMQGLLRAVLDKDVVVRSPGKSAHGRRWLELEVPTCAHSDSGRFLSSKPRMTSGFGSRTDCRVVTVFSVSGTDPTRVADLAENLRMWTEPVAMQILSTIFPTVRIWPRPTTAFLIALIHKLLRSLALDDNQWDYNEILERVEQVSSEREVVITGHSLGGGIALVVGALTDRLVVAFQPPGAYHSLAKHLEQRGVEAEGSQVHRRSFSLILEGDWIQNFDDHGGLVQTMDCDRQRESVALGCHMLEGLVCHLLWHCGDRRQLYSSCRHDYTASTVRSAVIELLRSATRSFHIGEGAASGLASASSEL